MQELVRPRTHEIPVEHPRQILGVEPPIDNRAPNVRLFDLHFDEREFCRSLIARDQVSPPSHHRRSAPAVLLDPL